ncbi:MAG TPA: hypothetical protein PK107_08415 [Candidatus Omnitrophota bacterium]|nr:hypothetical protein [Candidatus Omnitrophota bacterium]
MAAKALKYHSTLTPERWQSFGFTRQVLMIANELNRAGAWLEKSDVDEAKRCYERALELTWLTIGLQTEPGRIRELARFNEVLAGLYAEASPRFEDNALLLNALIMLDRGSYAALNNS